jgi:hypothetical protein
MCDGDDEDRKRRFLDPSKGATVALGKCYERRNRRGQQWFQGRLGDANVMIVPTGEIDRGDEVWAIVLAEGRDPQAGVVELARSIAAGTRETQ